MTDGVSRLGEHIRIAMKMARNDPGGSGLQDVRDQKDLVASGKRRSRVSLAVLASALWVLGFEKDLLEIAHPEKDQVGIYRERQRFPQRVRPSKARDDLDF